MNCAFGGHRNNNNSSNSSETTSKMFSLPIPNQETKPGETPTRRCNLYGKTEPLVSQFTPEVETMYESFQRASEKWPNRPYLGTRSKPTSTSTSTKAGPYTWISYAEAFQMAKSIGISLRTTLGMKPQSCLGLFSINRQEWMLTDHACCFASLITVPLYDTLGDEAIVHICSQTELAVVACSQDKVPTLLRLRENLKHLHTLVLFDEVSGELEAQCATSCLKLVAWKSLLVDSIAKEIEGDENEGEQIANQHQIANTQSNQHQIANQHQHQLFTPPLPSSIMTICYTSGTTGLPKGAIISHSTFIAELAGIMACSKAGKFIDIYSGPIKHLSFLPLAHVFERMVQHFFAACGGAIGFYQGDTNKLIDDAGELRPTVFIAVPRVLNRIYDRVVSGVSQGPSFKRWLFKTAFAWKRHFLRTGSTRSPIWDSVVFSRLKALLGGQVRAIVTGAAPISGEVLELVRICFACDVYEGYGQTESCAASFVSWTGDCTTGHVGAPLPSIEVKLVDVAEMEYFSTDQPYARGEICIRGPSCFSGYWKDPEKTAETIDSEGWIHTGDVGLFDARGRLKIIDRKKNIFKLAQGEYIAPERVENILAKHPLIAQIFVWGDSLKSCLVAVVVPEAEAVSKLMPGMALKEACQSAELMNAVLAAIGEFGSRGGGNRELKGFEMPRSVYLEHEPFSIANGLLTDTMKMKRHEAKKRYFGVINDLYGRMVE